VIEEIPQVLTVDLITIQRELLTEHIQVADGHINAKQMVRLVQVLQCDIESYVACFFIGDVAVSFDAQTVVYVHRDLVTYEAISGIKISLS
jgi:hypothetical protein